jgi:hypothetical protein
MTSTEKSTVPSEAPGGRRGSRVLRAVRSRFWRLANSIAYLGLARRLNRRTNLPFVIGHRPDFHSDFDRFPQYRELYDLWISRNVVNNSGDLARFYLICQNVAKILEEDVPGDFVELGVYKGNSAAILAALGRGKERHTYLFDTFSGFDARDLRGMDTGRGAQFADTSLAAVQELVGADDVTYVKGFFPESLSQVRLPEKIAVVHIDCDLYEPMKAGLEHFYPRVSRGGLILLHDYGSGHWPGTKRAVDEFFAHRPEKPIMAPDKAGTAVVRKV